MYYVWDERMRNTSGIVLDDLQSTRCNDIVPLEGGPSAYKPISLAMSHSPIQKEQALTFQNEALPP